MNERWYIIINPRAGSGKTMSAWMPAERLLKRSSIDFVSSYTEYRGHATELAQKAAKTGYRHILAVGGDGTLHEVFRGIMLFCDANGVSPSEFYLGAAPIGSGNDWIKSTGVPHDTTEVIGLIAQNSFGKMDVVRMLHSDGKVSYMANIGGVGFDPHVCERVNWQKEMGRRSTMIYLRGLMYTLSHIHPLRLKISVDDNEVFNGECYSIALGNGKYSGGVMCQVPKARIDDGVVDIMIVPILPVSRMVKEVPKLLTGSLDDNGPVIFAQGKTIAIEPLDENSEDIFEADGEIEGTLPLIVKVGDEQINVLMG